MRNFYEVNKKFGQVVVMSKEQDIQQPSDSQPPSQNEDLDKVRGGIEYLKNACSEAETIQSNLKLRVEGAEKQLRDLQGIIGELQDIQKKSENARSSVEEDILSINEAHEKLGDIIRDVNEREASLKSGQKELEDKIEKLTLDYREVMSLRMDLLEDQYEDVLSNGPDGNPITSKKVTKQSIKSEIENVLKQAGSDLSAIQALRGETEDEIASLIKTSKSDVAELTESSQQQFSSLREELRSRILEFLPDASAAGLSHGFVEAKKRYMNVWATIAYYIMFIVPLCAATFYFYNLQGTSLDEVSLLLRFLIVSPLLAISSFGIWSIRLNRRLFEEYNHKQRIMQLYDGFTKVVDEDESGEQKKELISIMLNAVKTRPSLTLSKYEKGGEGFLDVIFGRFRNGQPSNKTSEKE